MDSGEDEAWILCTADKALMQIARMATVDGKNGGADAARRSLLGANWSRTQASEIDRHYLETVQRLALDSGNRSKVTEQRYAQIDDLQAGLERTLLRPPA